MICRAMGNKSRRRNRRSSLEYDDENEKDEDEEGYRDGGAIIPCPPGKSVEPTPRTTQPTMGLIEIGIKFLEKTGVNVEFVVYLQGNISLAVY